MSFTTILYRNVESHCTWTIAEWFLKAHKGGRIQILEAQQVIGQPQTIFELNM
jgi:hypothetical protein